MSGQSLMVRDDARRLVNFEAVAFEIKTAALEVSALIGKVTTPREQEVAVGAQRELRRILKLTEEARKACKEPVLEFGRAIDAEAKAFQSELQAEESRVALLIADFQALELAKARAAESARLKDLQEQERLRQEELAQAKSLREVDSIHQKFNDLAAESAKNVPQPARVKGQIVREDWEITVTDIWALCRAHPMCVNIEPRLSEIRQLLDLGLSVAGVKAEKKVKPGVRLEREAKAIEA